MQYTDWYPIPGYVGLYEANSNGDIKSLEKLDIIGNTRKERILKPQSNNYGYTRVYLIKDGKGKRIYRHRIIASMFINNPKNKKEVNHKNGIKHDNRVTNLEWTTPKENTIHAYKTGLVGSRKGEKNNSSKLKNNDISRIRDLLKQGISASKISKKCNVCKSTICNIKNNKTWINIGV